MTDLTVRVVSEPAVVSVTTIDEIVVAVRTSVATVPVTVIGGGTGGGASLSDDDPEALGAVDSGTSDEASRADHVHPPQTIPPGVDLSDDNPENLGTTGAGNSDEASRADHVHDMPSAVDVGAATAAQGATADTAVQPGDLATVATSGAYGDLTGTPGPPDFDDLTDVTGPFVDGQVAVFDGTEWTGLDLFRGFASTSFIYNSSGVQEGTRYNDWADLMDAVGDISYGGTRSILFEQNETIPTVGMPVGGWNLNGAGFVGIAGSSPSAGTGATVIFPDGCKLANPGVDFATHGLMLWSQSTSWVVDISGTGRSIYLTNDAMVVSRSAAFFRVSATSGLTLFSLRLGAGIRRPSEFGLGGGDYESVEITGTPTLCITAEPIGYSNLGNNVFRSTAAQGMLRIVQSPAANTTEGNTQTNLGGGFYVVNQALAQNIAFTPTTSGDWDGPPATVAAALDEIASRVRAIEAYNFVYVGDPDAVPGWVRDDPETVIFDSTP